MNFFFYFISGVNVLIKVYQCAHNFSYSFMLMFEKELDRTFSYGLIVGVSFLYNAEENCCSFFYIVNLDIFLQA